jgi:phosphate-selective porin OprO and OprP
MPKLPSIKLRLAVFFLSSIPLLTHAGSAETEARINAMQQQMEAMSRELAAMQQQLATARQEKDTEKKEDEKVKPVGSPVMASFKDGITFEDQSGNWKMAINGRLQADYRHFSPDEDAADTFSLRRARLGATMTFYKDYVVRVEGEYSGSNTQLTYGYLDINTLPKAKIRIGQFKPFYGLERSMSTNFLDFQERSMADALLGSSYDRGVMVHGVPFVGTTYSVAYVNGTGTVDENDAKSDTKDWTLRLTANLAQIVDWKESIVHLGGFYADGSQGSQNQAGFIPTQRTEGRGLSFFSTTCAAAACSVTTANAFSENVDRSRAGLETILAHGPIKFQSEYLKTEFDGNGFEREMTAWYASAMWNVTGEKFAAMYRDGLMGRLRPNSNFKAGTDGWGALQIGIRYTNFDASDFTVNNAAGTGVLSGTATNEADSWTLGANWILNPNVRIVTNLIRTNYDTPVTVTTNGQAKQLDKEDALTMRAQFDF